MPNAKAHQNSGDLAGPIFAGGRALNAGQPLLPLALEAFGGYLGAHYVGSGLPDDLEPALGVGSHHRKLVHSKTSLCATVAFCNDVLKVWEADLRAEGARLWNQRGEGNWLDWLLSVLAAAACYILAGVPAGIAAGYVTHLLLDAGTPRGLPNLGLPA